MSKAIWKCRIDGQEHGPLDTKELQRLAETGKLKPTDLIWREGLKDWVPASKAKGLFPTVQVDQTIAESSPVGHPPVEDLLSQTDSDDPAPLTETKIDQRGSLGYGVVIAVILIILLFTWWNCGGSGGGSGGGSLAVFWEHAPEEQKDFWKGLCKSENDWRVTRESGNSIAQEQAEQNRKQFQQSYWGMKITPTGAELQRNKLTNWVGQVRSVRGGYEDSRISATITVRLSDGIDRWLPIPFSEPFSYTNFIEVDLEVQKGGTESQAVLEVAQGLSKGDWVRYSGTIPASLRDNRPNVRYAALYGYEITMWCTKLEKLTP